MQILLGKALLVSRRRRKVLWSCEKRAGSFGEDGLQRLQPNSLPTTVSRCCLASSIVSKADHDNGFKERKTLMVVVVLFSVVLPVDSLLSELK